MGIDLPLHVSQLGQLSLGCPRLMDPVLVEELVTTLSQETTAVPLWEVVVFFVLSAITYYRKQLSSNRVYMEHHHKKAHRASDVEWASSTPPLSPPPEPAGHDVDHPPSVALETALKGLPSHLHAKLKSMQEKLIKAMATRQKGGLEGEEGEPADLLSSLPQDAMLQVSRFLQPQDLLQLSQASRGLNDICRQPDIWREKWLARFGAMWDSDVAQEILSRRHVHLRAEQLSRASWRDFYFQFEACWMDWLIAGYNSEERCLVGLHGEVYDLTTFLDQHPGSRETIMVNAGSDATSFYEDVGHSNAARGRMREFVVLSPDSQVSRCCLSSITSGYRGRKKRAEDALRKEVDSGLLAAAASASGDDRPICRACGGVSYSRAPFATTPCAGGQHVGLVHAVADVLGGGGWSAWWSCCGQVVPVAEHEEEEGA